MKAQLVDFTQEALAKGISRAEISEALGQAGWPDADVRAALNAFADVAFPVPIPRPRPSLSARETFIYLIVFSAFYASIWSLISIIFDLIELRLPDPLFRGEERLLEAIRFSMSTLLVSFPLFLFTFFSANKALFRDPSKRNSIPRQWLTYLTMFLAICSIAGSLVGLTYNALGGELTMRFMLKALTVILAAGGTLAYFVSDMRKAERL